ncbi:uncharacterized protein N7446_010670 [Penicillium canescens]|uniref:uncharacterized protein n=1 Tax=Penicillium canescens TaxID=5083 RepID=UPI0026DF760F|nr:uncharacterized protein N7446_010670 [Penicillium canescens]KAJ6050561.1 hypothetical protein N7446_010670 [Penicillium canescens]
MPKRKADSDPQNSSKPKRDKYAENCKLADRIERSGVPVDSPCDYCFVRGKVCIMSPYSDSKKCSTCARRGQTCERSFHSDKEWDDLQRDEQRLAQELEEAQKLFLQHSQKMNEAMAKVLRLQTHQKFLKDRGGRMLNHDQAVSDRLNADDPPTADEFREFDRLAEQQEIRQLAATSEDASPLCFLGWSRRFLDVWWWFWEVVFAWRSYCCTSW